MALSVAETIRLCGGRCLLIPDHAAMAVMGFNLYFAASSSSEFSSYRVYRYIWTHRLYVQGWVNCFIVQSLAIFVRFETMQKQIQYFEELKGDGGWGRCGGIGLTHPKIYLNIYAYALGRNLCNTLTRANKPEKHIHGCSLSRVHWAIKLTIK